MTNCNTHAQIMEENDSELVLRVKVLDAEKDGFVYKYKIRTVVGHALTRTLVVTWSRDLLCRPTWTSSPSPR